MRPPYEPIVAHYEACLARHGDTHLGVDWPNRADADTRYRVMLEVMRRAPGEHVELLDFGCGAAHLYEFMQRCPEYADVAYSGADLSEAFVSLSRRKFPQLPFYRTDVLREPDALPEFDYVVLNGVLTERLTLSFDEMFAYAEELLARLFTKARVGMAFNVMSKRVDWERHDLFHVPFDQLAEMLARRLSRHFVFRHDYRLHEYTAYVYR
ncbi:MAG TPA: class I SAM-dependent methyltransferase [Gemmatimonadales bacterium]